VRAVPRRLSVVLEATQFSLLVAPAGRGGSLLVVVGYSKAKKAVLESGLVCLDGCPARTERRGY
jgi:hypothetical protein